MTRIDLTITNEMSVEAPRFYCELIERIVSKELENLDGLSREQLLDLRITTLQKLDAAIAAKLGGEVDLASNEQPKISPPKLSYAQAPLALAIPQYLATCDGPQTAKQIATALLEAGREFESNRPVHAVRMTLRKLVGTNPDIFHVYWAKWWLKSKCTKTQLEKYLAKNAKFGTGGHTKKEHSKRTATGIQNRRNQGLRWGPAPKATPELIERAKQMMRDGMTLTETCRQLDVAIPTLYQFGIRQRELKEEGKRLREANPDNAPKLGMSGDEMRAAGVIPLHAKSVGQE